MSDEILTASLPEQGYVVSTWVHRFRSYGIVWVTAALFLLLTVTTDGFLTPTNLRNILDQQAALLIAASVATLTMIAGGFDVSLSAIAIASGLTALRFENATDSIIIGILAGLLAGLVFGAFNALVVSVLKVNSFIATLATSFIIFGYGFVISERSILRPANHDFSAIARTRVFGLTITTYVAIAVIAISWFVLSRTRFGRYVYAAGGNAEAARLAGVRVSWVVAATFALGGLAAGLAGTLSAARTMSAQPSDSFSFVFAVIAAIVVGGTSIAGGEGAVWRTVLGALFIAIMINGFNLHQIDPIFQRVVQGSVILGAVGIDAWSQARRG
ncbi:MAG: hypothetical protein GWP04_08995 [Gammaproteobacteria bacterium]|nr:hypothetical protein [Gammaproteobacteria bacterium]